MIKVKLLNGFFSTIKRVDLLGVVYFLVKLD